MSLNINYNCPFILIFFFQTLLQTCGAQSQHANIRAVKSTEVDIELQLRSRQIGVAEPLWIQVTVTNNLDYGFELLSPEMGAFTGPALFARLLRKESGEELRIIPILNKNLVVIGGGSIGGNTVEPGESISILGNVFISTDGFVFREPGRYSLYVELHAGRHTDQTNFVAASSTVEVEVSELPLDDREALHLWSDACEIATDISDCGLNSQREASKLLTSHTSTGIDKYLSKIALFDRIREDFPHTKYGAYCMFFFADQYSILLPDEPRTTPTVNTAPLESLLEFGDEFPLAPEVRLKLAERYLMAQEYQKAFNLLQALPLKEMDDRDVKSAGALEQQCQKGLKK